MLELKHVNKYYGFDLVLDDINLCFDETGLIGIQGQSGCGKSTLLHLIGGIDQQYEGEISGLEESSFMFQQPYLIHWLNCEENISLRDFFSRIVRDERKADDDLIHVRVGDMSIGQRQRVAFERALYGEPGILLCDEPTSALDHERSERLMQALKYYSEDHLVICVSHDQALLKRYADRLITMQDGQIIADTGLIHTGERKVQCSRHQFHLLRLTSRMIKRHLWHFCGICLTLMLAVFCIMLTFLMATSFKQSINAYLRSLIPPASISFKCPLMTLTTHPSFDDLEGVDRTFYYIDGCELLGLSFSERYDQSRILTISDESGLPQNLLYGRMMQSDDEIILPLSTAQVLAQSDEVNSLLNQSIYIYYHYEKKVRACPVRIVGITSQQLRYTAFYQPEGAQIHHLQSLFSTPLQTSFGILYYHGDHHTVMKALQASFPAYRFKVVGETTEKKVNQSIAQAELILALFSFLTLLSSLFLTGEIMYLHTLECKRDFAIMRCFQGRLGDLLLSLVLQAVMIHMVSFLLALGGLMVIKGLLSTYIMPALIDFQFTLKIQPVMIGGLWIGSFFIVLMATLFSLVYVAKLDVVKVLRHGV